MMETDRQYNELLWRCSPRQGAKPQDSKKRKRQFGRSPKPEPRFEGTKPQAILSEEVAARQEAYHLKRVLRHGGGKFKKQHKG